MTIRSKPQQQKQKQKRTKFLGIAIVACFSCVACIHLNLYVTNLNLSAILVKKLVKNSTFHSINNNNHVRTNRINSSYNDTPAPVSNAFNISLVYWWRGRMPNADIIVNMTDPEHVARHPNGTLGWIVDPSPERLKPFDMNHTQDYINRNIICPNSTYGIEGEGGHLALIKIKNGLKESRLFLEMRDEAISGLNSGKTSKNISNSKLIIAHDHRGEIRATYNYTEYVDNLTETVTVDSKQVRARRSKIMCMIYTVHLPPNYRNPNLNSQAETWGRDCDGFIAVSNYTDHQVGAIDLTHYGPEEYGNMWQKIRSMWAYAYENYLDDYDFFHICGDDVYMIMDNLRAYLDGPEVTRLENGYVDRIYSFYQKKWIQDNMFKQLNWTPDKGPRPLIFGIPMHWASTRLFPAGGPGYTLNRAALDLFGKEILPEYMTHYIDPKEDLIMGEALRLRGAPLSDTKDKNETERYAGSAQNRFSFNGISPISPGTNTRKYGIQYPHGMSSVSPQSCCFHLKDDRAMLKSKGVAVHHQMYRYYVFLNDLC